MPWHFRQFSTECRRFGNHPRSRLRYLEVVHRVNQHDSKEALHKQRWSLQGNQDPSAHRPGATLLKLVHRSDQGKLVGRTSDNRKMGIPEVGRNWKLEVWALGYQERSIRQHQDRTVCSSQWAVKYRRCCPSQCWSS